ncbi:uncharacterized protein si:dkey-102g19.3 [Onychostoma macrolepis]|uniref:Snake toxin/toxin-like domain-containing protein n=1 Tax=Onychostoma macrolepis TaxID=369639 RepID=A0A7J6BVA9_9TELE|nr:uncharacterized protein si:dkey-102g19.3 [Onychostoma macrolepis]XP_058614834.1 uncharacterized protein si:dkey-102g19.3 [Onychostoma macrolepis]KAF4098927.1 hypothetical protein G5714_020957 [Onychostoma macrolepis]
MHLRVSIVLLFILLTGGFSLNCYDCQDQQRDTCTKEKTCNGKHTKCASTKTVDYFGRYRNLTEERVRIGNSTRLKYKQATCWSKYTAPLKETFSWSCAMPHECKSWSFSTGCWRKMFYAQCCNTKFCNQKKATGFSSTSHNPNGKKCFTCDDVGCSKVMSCWGDENQCFTTKANETLKAIKGCASKPACDRELGRILESYGNITCCSGYLCNGAQSVTQSFLFLCCSLLSFILLH